MAGLVGHSVVVRRVAVATVDLLGVVYLILFFVVGGPFGSINDVANAAVGVLSAVLASHLVLPTRSDPAARR